MSAGGVAPKRRAAAMPAPKQANAAANASATVRAFIVAMVQRSAPVFHLGWIGREHTSL